MTALNVHIQEKVFANGLCALSDLQFETRQGQFTAIVGPSGAGKTTLLNIIAGLDGEFSGTLTPAGRKLHMGFMFQEARLLPWLTVQQNLELVIGALPTHAQPALLKKAPELLHEVGLQGFSDAFPRQLSIGMQRRVSLLRAFIIQPELLLMDEPFQSLDEPTADQLRQLLLKLWQETRSSVVFVTHNLREALALADRILFLSVRPAKVILDYTIECARPRQTHDDEVNRIHHELLQTHPELLSGAIEQRIIDR